MITRYKVRNKLPRGTVYVRMEPPKENNQNTGTFPFMCRLLLFDTIYHSSELNIYILKTKPRIKGYMRKKEYYEVLKRLKLFNLKSRMRSRPTVLSNVSPFNNRRTYRRYH